MIIENLAKKKALLQGKAIGFYHREHGQVLNDDALEDLACSEAFAFAHTSRLYSRWASTVRPLYERAFMLGYSEIVSR